MKGFQVAVMTTPLNDRLQPDLAAVERMAERLCHSPAEALFPCASTGEFVHFSPEANQALMRRTAEVARGRRRLYAGICAPDLRQSVAYLEYAKKLGADACVACPPYYYPLPQRQVTAYYRQLCRAAEGMPIIAYHAPFFTTGIEADSLRELLETTPLRGIKDSSANLKRIGHLLNLAQNHDFTVYTGTDDCLLGALAMGCGGSMTALGSSVPERVGAIYRAWERGDLSEARRLQQQLMPLLALADSLVFPLGYKLIAELALGMPGGYYLQTHDPREVETVREAMRTLMEKWGDSL